MDLQTAAKVFKQLNQTGYLMKLAKQYEEARRYYRNENDITREGLMEKAGIDQKETPLRSYNSQISSNFHQLLVDQKTSYVGSIPPEFDVENDKANDAIKGTLGDKYPRVIQRLMADASNAGVAWLHVWKDGAGEFQYAIVPPDQVTPIFNNDIERDITAIRRTYRQMDQETGDFYIHEEYWTDKEVSTFKRLDRDGQPLMLDNRFIDYEAIAGDLIQTSEPSNTMTHDFGRVPFIEFGNNSEHTSDLIKYKGLIDGYDLIYNGFINDLMDVQQVILVLTGYEGENLADFRQNLAKWKAIKLADDLDQGNKAGIDKLTIDIPTDARKIALELTKEKIFIDGQGVDPTKLELGNNSGVALKMLYGLLELKAAALEAEFRPGLAQLVRFILGPGADKTKITQKWYRASIQNDVEQADVVAKLADVTSKENVAKSNPLVEDWQRELELQEDEKEGADQFANPAAMAQFGSEDQDSTEDSDSTNEE
jgi:SPP1 family phage portal protein